MTPRHLRRDAALQTVLWITVVVVANHLASAIPIRIDATGDQRFTLSQAAHDAVAHLERTLVVTAYFTADLDAPYHEHEAALRDTLDALAVAGAGRIDVQFVDPSTAERAEAAQRDGITPVTYTVRAWDRQEARSVFMGVHVGYGDRQMAVPALMSIPKMEVELVRAIRILTVDPEDRRKVALLQGHGEPNPADYPAQHPLYQLRARLGERYEVVQTVGDAPFDEDIAAVLTLAPTSPMPAATLWHLDQFLMGGGALGFFVASAQPDYPRGATFEVRHGIGGFLGSYGLALGREVVLDRVHNEKITLPAPGGRTVQVDSPLALTTTHVERTAHAVRSLRSATFPFAAPVVVADPLPEGIQAEVWIRSGPESTARPGPIPLDPRLLGEPAASEVAGPHVLAAVATGAFPSFFQGQPPPGVRADEPLAKGRLGRLLVVGSGDAAANNVDFVLNSVEWLLEDPSLATIRARATGDGPMTPPPAETAWRWKIAVVAPQLLLGLGLAWRVRRRRLA